LEKVYKALGARKRLEILKLLADGKELAVGDIAAAIHLSFKSTSKHLVLLRQVGFLEWSDDNLGSRAYIAWRIGCRLYYSSLLNKSVKLVENFINKSLTQAAAFYPFARKGKR